MNIWLIGLIIAAVYLMIYFHFPIIVLAVIGLVVAAAYFFIMTSSGSWIFIGIMAILAIVVIHNYYKNKR